MPQNNEREALIQLLNATAVSHGQYNVKSVNKARKIAIEALQQSQISQNEQREAVGEVVNEDGYSEVFVDFFDKTPPPNGTKLYTSPPKQIPDGWKPIETVPKDGTQVIIKCSGGRVATAFYDDKQFIGEGWHVVVPFLGGFGSGTDTFIYFQEDMPTHWMPLPTPTTSLTSETNTEVWE